MKKNIINFSEAERNARKRDFEKDSEARIQVEELKKSLLQQLKELTGEEHFIGTRGLVPKMRIYNVKV